MNIDSEKYLPEKILQKASVRGKEYAWKKEDLIEAILSAKKNRLASIGGQVRFKLPDGCCELYWISFDSDDKIENESWDEYVVRSADEVILKFKKINVEFDLIDEGYKSFQFLKDKVTNDGIVLSDYLCFVAYFNDENTYYRLIEEEI